MNSLVPNDQTRKYNTPVRPPASCFSAGCGVPQPSRSWYALMCFPYIRFSVRRGGRTWQDSELRFVSLLVFGDLDDDESD